MDDMTFSFTGSLVGEAAALVIETPCVPHAPRVSCCIRILARHSLRTVTFDTAFVNLSSALVRYFVLRNRLGHAVTVTHLFAPSLTVPFPALSAAVNAE